MLILRYALLSLLCGAFTPCAFGQQKMQADSIALPKEAGRMARNDEVFFDAEKAKMHDDDKLATELFEKFSALNPDVPDGYYELSKLYYNYKNLDKSEETIKKAISLDKDNKWYKEQYATILAGTGTGSRKQPKSCGGTILEAQPDELR